MIDFPGNPFSYSFMDESLLRKYEPRISTEFGAFSFAGVFSDFDLLLGLFGLAA